MLNNIWQGFIHLTWLDWGVIFIITIPLSMFLYLLKAKKRHHMLVDLGNHKWIIDEKDN